MKKIPNWNEIPESGSNRQLPPGGYLCVITSALDVPEQEYLKLEFDIADGDFKGYGRDFLERNGWTPLRFVRSYKEKAYGMFKAFISGVEKANPGYSWDFNEMTLVGRKVGLLLGEEEYRKNDGGIGTRLRVARILTPEEVAAGNFKVPEKKMLVITEEPPAWLKETVEDNSLPFDL